MPVKIPLIDGSGWHLARTGWEIRETAIVSKVVGLGPELIFNAYQELVSFGIDINQPHPVVFDAFCTDIEPGAISNDAVTFRITFKQYDFRNSVIEVSSSVAQVETDKDSEGNLVTVEYKYPDDYEWNADLQGVTKTQTGLLSKIQPEPSISITRREVILGIDLTGKKLLFEGKVNQGGWLLEPDAPTGTWLCTSIGGRSQDNGLTYDVTYTFQFRRNDWGETARFIDPGTGQAPADLVDGVGFKDVRIYETADFNLLGLGIIV